jgi:hypothetical protein
VVDACGAVEGCSRRAAAPGSARGSRTLPRTARTEERCRSQSDPRGSAVRRTRGYPRSGREPRAESREPRAESRARLLTPPRCPRPARDPSWSTRGTP